MFALGIDIGGSSVKVAVCAGDAAAHLTRSGAYTCPDGEAVMVAVAEALSMLPAGSPSPSPQSPGQAVSVGVCAPGLVDEARGVVLASANLPALVGFPLGQRVRALVEARGWRVERVAFLPDAHAAAFDAWATRTSPAPRTPPTSPAPPGPPVERLLALSIGTGVGACVLDAAADGGMPTRLLVSGGSSGHLGQMDVGFDEAGPGGAVTSGPVGRDGAVGSLEAYIGLAGLRARYGADVEAALPRLTANDAPVRALVRGLRIAHAIYRPNAIVLLGGIGVRLRHLGPALHAAVAQSLTSLARPGWTLEFGHDDHHAARGAAMWGARGGAGAWPAQTSTRGGLV
ncbi:MAG: ROK family protein [Phycisphaerales bacterium]